MIAMPASGRVSLKVPRKVSLSAVSCIRVCASVARSIPASAVPNRCHLARSPEPAICAVWLGAVTGAAAGISGPSSSSQMNCTALNTKNTNAAATATRANQEEARNGWGRVSASSMDRAEPDREALNCSKPPRPASPGEIIGTVVADGARAGRTPMESVPRRWTVEEAADLALQARQQAIALRTVLDLGRGCRRAGLLDPVTVQQACLDAFARFALTSATTAATRLARRFGITFHATGAGRMRSRGLGFPGHRHLLAGMTAIAWRTATRRGTRRPSPRALRPLCRCSTRGTAGTTTTASPAARRAVTLALAARTATAAATVTLLGSLLLMHLAEDLADAVALVIGIGPFRAHALGTRQRGHQLGRHLTDRDLLFNIGFDVRSEEHTSELQSRPHLVCR